MFQFLIGRLKILKSITLCSIPKMFQFLIGRLKMIKEKTIDELYEEFQFLIGRLKILPKNFTTGVRMFSFNSS